MMRTRLLLVGSAVAATLSVNSFASAATYYVDSVGGDDGNNGTSDASPYKDLSKISRLASGDVLNLKAGSSWEKSGGFSVSGATVQRYGDGPNPVIIGTGDGYAVLSVQSNATVDGITVRGTGKATQGIGVMGSKNVIRNCEVDGSDKILQLGFGVMGEGNLITQNYVHDLSGMSGDSGDMNTSGGAEAYMVMASDNEISYNSAVRCFGPNSTLGGFEGGCLEIVNGKAGSTISNVRFHHNYCEASVGLFEGCSGNFQGTDKIQENHGKIVDCEVSYNISVDAMWLYLLQPVNTDFTNLKFFNNTIIHTDNSWTLWERNDSFTMAVSEDQGYKTDNEFFSPSTGFLPGTVIVRNNIFVDAVSGHALYSFFSSKMSDHSNNLFAPANAKAGITLDATEKSVSIEELAFTPDYRLTSNSSVAIDKGVANGFTEDIDHHSVPCGASPDIGASEYCDGAGGSTGTGGVASSSTGGVPASTGTGNGNGGTSTASTGTQPSTGGARSSNTTSTAASQGGSNPSGSGGTTVDNGNGGDTNRGDGGSSVAVSSGGQQNATSSVGSTSVASAGGATSSAGDPPPATTGGTVGSSVGGEEPGCQCRYVGTNRRGLGAMLASMGLGMLLLGRRRRAVNALQRRA